MGKARKIRAVIFFGGMYFFLNLYYQIDINLINTIHFRCVVLDQAEDPGQLQRVPLCQTKESVNGKEGEGGTPRRALQAQRNVDEVLIIKEAKNEY